VCGGVGGPRPRETWRAGLPLIDRPRRPCGAVQSHADDDQGDTEDLQHQGTGARTTTPMTVAVSLAVVRTCAHAAPLDGAGRAMVCATAAAAIAPLCLGTHTLTRR
jgi:hypothetical protein